MSKLYPKVLLFSKGVLMGLADIVPGVSGGTMALITGIYEDLIFSINSIEPIAILSSLVKRDFDRFKKLLTKIELVFLINLGLGIIIAIFLASKLIIYALNFFPTYTYSFFFGLILVSAIKIYERIDGQKGFYPILFLIIGIVFAFLVTGLEKLGLLHTPIIIFFSGALAVLAMVLPGISGSFILLIIGQYEYMLNTLHNLSTRFLEASLFVFGAILSLFAFTDALSFILKKYKRKTLAFLTGLMIGALRLPGSKLIYAEQIFQKINFKWNIVTISSTIIFFLIGSIFVFVIEK
ncbi:DUF368 domain-containing protein [archaeon SCG-AAA382B04]|nr:DUF368 domain-containing protein [archaeon SCG-AAA382B04]